MFENVNEVAILVSALLAVAVGNVWYSPVVFGPAWMRSIGKLPGDDVLPKETLVRVVAVAVLTHVIFFFAIAHALHRIQMSHISLLESGLFVMVLIISQCVSVGMWEQKNYTYFLINAGYSAIIIFGGLAVMMYWPW